MSHQVGAASPQLVLAQQEELRTCECNLQLPLPQFLLYLLYFTSMPINLLQPPFFFFSFFVIWHMCA